MRKRDFRYYCRMVIKTILCLVPLLIIIFFMFQPNDNVNTFLINFEADINNFASIPLNSWYTSLLEALGFDTVIDNVNSFAFSILTYLPLYFIWIEIFDLVLHLVFFFTDLFHKFLGGDK